MENKATTESKTPTEGEGNMDIKARINGGTIHLEALNANGDAWLGSNGSSFLAAGPARFTFDGPTSELHQIMICAGWDGIKIGTDSKSNTPTEG